MRRRTAVLIFMTSLCCPLVDRSGTSAAVKTKVFGLLGLCLFYIKEDSVLLVCCQHHQADKNTNKCPEPRQGEAGLKEALTACGYPNWTFVRIDPARRPTLRGMKRKRYLTTDPGPPQRPHTQTQGKPSSVCGPVQ